MGGDGDDGVKAVPGLAVSRDHRQQLRRFHRVNLVDAQNTGDFLLPDPVDQGLFRASHVGNGFHQQQRAVHITEAGGNHFHHIVPQGGLGPVKARGVQQNILGVLPVDHAVDPVAGGLGLVGDNGHFLSHQGVGKAGFAHVWPAADRDHGGVFDIVHQVILNFLVKHFGAGRMPPAGYPKGLRSSDSPSR